VRQLWSFSARIGLGPTIACAALWLGVGGSLALRVGQVLASIPTLALTVSLGMSVIVSLGALVSYWLICDHVTCRKRGFRMRWVRDHHWLYEEIGPAGESRFLPCERVMIASGYPAPCVVRIASEGAWSTQMPAWAWCRREEILQRITVCFGADQGGIVRFTDTPADRQCGK
jgi:hypothetical protein